MNPTPLSDEMLDTLQRETFEYFRWSCRQTSARAVRCKNESAENRTIVTTILKATMDRKP